MRFSRQREMVYQTLCSTRSHPTANWVYEQVKQHIPNISLGTVYRNLAELCSCGKVKKVTVCHDTEHYDADVTPHSHLVCSCCGKIMDAPSVSVDVDTANFAVDSVEVTIYGKCENCR